LSTTRRLEGRGEGLDVYTYETVPGVPPVSIMRLDRGSMEGIEAGHAHSHDFLALAYFERGGGSLRLGGRECRVEAGDVYIVAPGEVIGVGDDASGLAEAEAWCVFFPPEGLGPKAPDALLSWRAHPLLFPFARGVAAGAQRLKVPLGERTSWIARLSALDLELRERRDGYREAVVAHLTLLLVDLSRLAADIVGDLRQKDEPLLAEVFGFIEERYPERVSLKDVASSVSLSPAYLTTIVRRKTGRTVQEWIAERRMAQARRLLVESDLTVEEVGRRVGYADPVYFARSFRRTHGTTPLRWRRAGRP
jgi:AraC family transcriptional regulator, transcriptional activator of pobA